MKQLALLTFLFVAFHVFAADPLPVIAPEEATAHVGETVLVHGKVDQVSAGKTGAVFLNFGGKFPKEKFMVYIRGLGTPDVWEHWEGQTVYVEGTIKIYRGKPEIALEAKDKVRDTP